ncbi:MAG: DUF4252 domain-containing protein [Bacteroidales bacterium]|jgi:hypothetical protein|nr:DUF4252 domain-containing protein [Bacteroidales bacterium]
MKVKIFFTIAILVVLFNSCITQDKYKETDIYEEFETEKGFGVFHVPPVLFRIVFSIADEQNDEFASKDLLDKIDVIKVLFFEEKDNTISINDLKKSMNLKIKSFNYNLLTRIAQENNDISIFVINNDEIIREVLITIVSDNDYISLNLIGEFSKDEVMQVYKSVNMKEILNYSN